MTLQCSLQVFLIPHSSLFIWICSRNKNASKPNFGNVKHYYKTARPFAPGAPAKTKACAEAAKQNLSAGSWTIDEFHI